MSVHVGYTVTDNTVPNSHSGAPPLRLAQSYTPRKSLQINGRQRGGMTYLNPKFNDLPVLQVLPVMSDDEREFRSFMDYLGDLVSDIFGNLASMPPEQLMRHQQWLDDQDG